MPSPRSPSATARPARRGRISLNPLAHIDPFGTVLLPLIMIALGGPVFAFAKPVPVHLGNLRHPKRDEVLVALAGPLSNIALALVAAAAWWLVPGEAVYGAFGYAVYSGFMNFIVVSILINLSLAFFNLIPLPPLDGSSILVPFLKGRALPATTASSATRCRSSSSCSTCCRRSCASILSASTSI